jgi:hypothetical protein
MGDKVEQIEDREELAQVRRQARAVNIKTLVTALALTAGALLLPEL